MERRHLKNTRITLALLMVSLAAPTATRCAADSVIGAAPRGQNALEFLGRSDQDGPTVTHYGYMTRIYGLDDAGLFSGQGVRTEATARFTYFATTTLNARHELGALITTAAPGTMTVYYQGSPGASFNDPRSFARGTPIATFSLRYHNTLTVLAPNSGVMTATADLLQVTSPIFTLNGQRRHLGAPGLRLRLTATGLGTRTQENPLKASFILGGNMVVPGF